MALRQAKDEVASRIGGVVSRGTPQTYCTHFKNLAFDSGEIGFCAKVETTWTQHCQCTLFSIYLAQHHP